MDNEIKTRLLNAVNADVKVRHRYGSQIGCLNQNGYFYVTNGASTVRFAENDVTCIISEACGKAYFTIYLKGHHKCVK